MDERDELTTRAGVVLTPDAEATLTAEAEEGFDPEGLVSRPLGPASSTDATPPR